MLLSQIKQKRILGKVHVLDCERTLASSFVVEEATGSEVLFMALAVPDCVFIDAHLGVS